MTSVIHKSLTNRIIFYFLLVAASLIISIFFTFEEAGKEAFKTMEEEKAQVLAKTILPAISVNLYLGLEKKVDRLVKDLLQHNKNIVGITILSNGKITANYLKKDKDKQDYFVMTKYIHAPNSKDIIGRMHILYSYAHYNALVKKYEKLLWIFLAGITVLLVLFSVYLDQLLSPLKKIVAKLKNYSPQKDLRFPFSDRPDEIGAISSALERMQESIQNYARKQEAINKILEQKVQEKTKELRERLYIDSLTKLPNRFKLQEDLSSFKQASVIIINIDDFKEINDLFGHETGDKILKDFAIKLKSLLRVSYPKLYRLSGDEFALVFNKKLTKSDMIHFLDRLIKNIENMAFKHEEKELALRVSVGASLGKDGALEKADIALKKAKKRKRVYEIYQEDDKAVEKQYEHNIRWIKKLKQSIELERVVPFFQPIINVQTQKPKGYECLVRIVDEDGKVSSPGEFLEIAKKSKFYFQLTSIMIEKSCRYFESSECSFSVNFSIEDILNPEIVKKLEESIQNYGVANRLILEIVESEGIENYDVVYDFVYRMKKIGCQIAIDDFGSGYSNFEHVLKLPIDFIKIDGSLIKNIVADSDSEIIVSTIVDMAKKKGIKTVAEFVSSENIFTKVKSLGVDYVQGYYFAQPKPDVDTKCLVQ